MLCEKSQLLEGLNKIAVLAVGPKTAQELVEYGVFVNLVLARYSFEGNNRLPKKHGITDKTVCFLRTKEAPLT